MHTTNTNRCPHYQLYSEPLEMDGPPAFLAIRRCLLTERQVHLLAGVPEGQAFVDRLVVRLRPGKVYAFVGPDLEAVTQEDCTVQRCEQRCTPGYIQRLSHFEILDPGLDNVTCQEEGPEEMPLKKQEKSTHCTQT